MEPQSSADIYLTYLVYYEKGGKKSKKYRDFFCSFYLECIKVYNISRQKCCVRKKRLKFAEPKGSQLIYKPTIDFFEGWWYIIFSTRAD